MERPPQDGGLFLWAKRSALHLQRIGRRNRRQAQRHANRFVGQLASMHVKAVQQVLVIGAGLFQPLLAKAIMKGNVALPSAWVEVRATAPGMLATQ